MYLQIGFLAPFIIQTSFQASAAENSTFFEWTKFGWRLNSLLIITSALPPKTEGPPTFEEKGTKRGKLIPLFTAQYSVDGISHEVCWTENSCWDEISDLNPFWVESVLVCMVITPGGQIKSYVGSAFRPRKQLSSKK